jgi:hypothetical protein
MRLNVRISSVEPGIYELSEQCLYPDCEGRHFEMHQRHCAKALHDPTYEDVEAQRQICLRCGRYSPALPTPSPTLEE